MSLGKSLRWRIFTDVFIKVFTRTLELSGTWSYASLSSSCRYVSFLSVSDSDNRALVKAFNDNARKIFQFIQSLSFFLWKILFEGFLMSSNLSSKQVKCLYNDVLITWVKGKLRFEKDHSSFLKYHIRRSFSPSSSNSVFFFARSITLTVDKNFKSLNSNEIWEAERFFPEGFINPIQDGLFRGCLGMGGPKKAPFTKICHTYPAIMKPGTVIP